MHWKKWRWLSWAAERGMISTEELLPEIKCYKLVSPFRKVSEYVMYNQPSKAAISYHPPAPAVSKVKIPAKKTKEKESQKGKQEKKLLK